VKLSDATGSTEVTLFSEVLSRSRDMLEEGTAVLVTAEARLDGESLRLTAQDVETLERAAQGVAQGIRLWLERTEALEPIRALLGREGRGRGRVVIVPVTGPGQEVEIALQGGFNISPRLMQAMKVIPGVAEVQEL
jgi:DNA polymerase-3 subunit alpha